MCWGVAEGSLIGRRIIMFPRGNYKKEKKKALYFALYLGIDDFEQLDRRVDVKLILSVVNHKFSNKCSGESQRTPPARCRHTATSIVDSA